MTAPAAPFVADCSLRVPRTATRRLWGVLALTGLFMVVEAVGGWMSHSLALLADAAHMLTDVAALGLSLGTAWLAQRPATEQKTYGYLRWEILAALINGAALFGIAGWVVVEAVHRLGEPPAVRSGLLMAVAAAGLATNLLSLRLLHGAHEHSLNTRGAYLHIMGDLLGSAGALAAGAVIAWTGWTPIDPILSILLSLLILGGAWRLVKESTDVLLEAVPRHVSMAEVHRRMLEVPGVAAVHDLHVWTVTSGLVAMSGHAVVPALADHPRALQEIRLAMGRLGIGHVTIQLEREPAVCEDLTELAATAGGHGHDHHGHHHHDHGHGHHHH
jgi:cobalt-zinc-cadmium efflux system protein